MEKEIEIKHHQINVGLDFDNYPPDNYNPLFFTKVNGAVVNQNKLNAFIGIDNLNNDGVYNECYCILEQGDKLGDFFSVLPYGIINKTITGIGATTLELNCERNSIIVLPTKSLAYNKYKLKQTKDGVDSCMYIGSPMGDVSSDITINQIKDYISKETGYKKFLVVADSLFKVIDAIGDDNYDDYFLMVDEIDTLQIDNTYRPVLEKVIDYYALFKQTNRAVVSATIRKFTHPELLKETIITTKYPIVEKRNISLVHTNNEDICIVKTIKELIEENPDEKILIAYNSIDAIFICIMLLKKELGELIVDDIGILCSEKSRDKVQNLYIEIDENGYLTKKIAFMTCAYFVGVDINDSCHIISVSSFNKPFTLLSKEKLAQIVGRCRNGILSETIIYNTKESESPENYYNYRNTLMKKAVSLVEATNKFKETLDVCPELFNAYNYISNILKHVALERVSASYSIPLIRENYNGAIVPSYFNIDALLEKWELRNELYNDEESLPNALREDGHEVENNDWYSEFTEEQKEYANLISNNSESRILNALQEAKEKILFINGINSDNEYKIILLEKERRNCIVQIQKFYDYYIYLSPYYETNYLIDLLIENHMIDNRLYKKFINSLIFHTLDETHPFKSLVLGVFEYHKIEEKKGKRLGITVTINDRKEKMNSIRDSYFKGYNIKDRVFYSLMPCFFKEGSTKRYFRILGLNPMEFQEPIEKIKTMDAEILFRWFMFE